MGSTRGQPSPSCPDMGNQDHFDATGPTTRSLHELSCATTQARSSTNSGEHDHSRVTAPATARSPHRTVIA